VVTYAERVREAVNDPEWQEFRRSLKGMDTASKINNLKDYYNDQMAQFERELETHGITWIDDEHIEIRVDNYLKALARGGQLPAGASLEWALTLDWNLRILK
jgi:hypothetical protein